MNKPFSQACVNNQQPILEVLRSYFNNPSTLLEIGSGTGQHAVYLAHHLPHLQWQPTDLAIHLDGIQLWLDEAALENILPPLALNVADKVWPIQKIQAAFTANTLHIMSWENVVLSFQQLGEYLLPNAIFCSYGPYNIGGQYTSDSNAQFDRWLKRRDPLSGIRNIEDLQSLAESVGMQLLEVVEMPANNKILVWQKVSANE